MKATTFKLTSTILIVTLIVGMSINYSSLQAQKPEPQVPLGMPVLNVNGQQGNTEVYLQALDIQVDVTGHIASTKFTMTFKNRTNKVLEGELLFPMPDGVTVSHYALDINGKMREAVPVEKAKATQVFEEIVYRRVDPGLLERVEGNNFRTRIYPIPANGTRTVSIGYETELPIEESSFYYRLPMDYKEAIEKFSLKTTVWKGSSKPKTSGGGEELRFDRQGENYVAEFSRENYQANRSLIFSLPAPENVPLVIMQSASGSYYFVASCVPQTKTIKKQWSNKLGIIWDASLSGMQRDIEKELELLGTIINEKQNLSVSLYLLNNRFSNKGKNYIIQNGDWSKLQNELRNTIYDGGTNYSAINLVNAKEDEFLLFSDGISTISNAEIQTVNKPIHCIVSSAKADYSSLKWIAAKTNGKFINLNALSQTEINYELHNETLHFLGIENNSSVREVYPSVATPVRNSFSIAGILDNSQTTVTLLFGYGNKVEKRVAVKLDSKETSQQGNVYRIWAQKKINELDMRYEQNKDELSELGRQFGIVTRNTSLIVLETLQDYITYNITPPAELQQEYFNWRKGQDDAMQRQEENLINNAIAAANDLKQWWERDFTPPTPKYPQPDGGSSFRATERTEQEIQRRVANVADVDMEEIPAPAVMEVSFDMVEDARIESAEMESSDVLITALGSRKEAKMQHEISVNKPQPVIRLTPLKQDNEYSKQLTGKVDEDYNIYLKLRPDYINTPTFYFDMADWFFKLNDRETALRILTSIADLELENASLFRLLGYRLKEYNEYELEAFVCRKVIEWRPMEPQSYRDYALALADNENYQESLNNLYAVLTQSYAQNINQRNSRGIEEVVVTEINQLVTQHKGLDTSAIDQQLLKSMPVDVRVVINWNMNNTDIDLHVKDPRGETCSYRNKSTAIGGRISRDITQGYGPEQFMLKKAIRGKYEVFVNYFGDSQVKAEGPSTIMVEIYTNYSSKEEVKQVVCVQLSKDNKPSENGMLKVAEFEF